MMNIEELRAYCIAKEDVTEGFPFGEQTLVFKAKGKMFVIAGLERIPLMFNAKCDPERAIALREEYDAIIPGYHTDKKHWNSIICDGTVSNKLIKELIDHSYDLVTNPKPKAKKRNV